MKGVTKIPFLLVTGFLGSGKTTFLKQLLEGSLSGKRTAVIQNEYASANIDTAQLQLRGEHYSVMEVNKGSVFCVCLLANFVDSLAAFIDQYQPDVLVLEASGLSDPIAVAELFQHEKLTHKTVLMQSICIIDLDNYHKVINMAERLKRQVMIADLLVLNKMDRASDRLEEVRTSVRNLNPHAAITGTSFCRLDDDPVFPGRESGPVAAKAVKMAPLGRADIRTVVLKTAHMMPENRLRQFLGEVDSKCLRIKGFVQVNKNETLAVQSVLGQTEISKIDYYQGPTELIGIGESITPAEFGRRFHEIRKSN